MLRKVIICLSVSLVLALGLAWVSSDLVSVEGWGAFWTVSLLGSGLLWGGWQIVRRESAAPWLGGLLLASFALRLGLGVFWYRALPVLGYGNPAEQAGYVMADAYERDIAAWELAQSERPLWDAFDAYRSVDQYGGMLFISAVLYRYAGGAVHQPLLIVMLAAVVSSLAVVFTWGFAQRLWGANVARVAAWMLALYPEAVLLGSSQMREAFTVTLAAAVFFGLVLAWQERSRVGALSVWALVLLSVPLSPTFALLLTGAVLLLAIALAQGHWRRERHVWAVVGGLVIVGVLGLWFFSAQVARGGGDNPLAILQHWIERTRIWQTILTRQASGWMAKVFASTPLELHAWIVLGYGVVQPFLPAALIANGNLLWRGVAIWRALGWTLFVPFLIYAPWRALRKPRQWPVLASSLVVWGVILAAAYRAGGDQWDNPRYRVAFASLQVALAAWVWVEQRRAPDAGLWRVLIAAGWVLVWFLPWYLRRYTGLDWPVVDVFKTFGLGLASAFLYTLADWARAHRRDAG